MEMTRQRTAVSRQREYWLTWREKVQILHIKDNEYGDHVDK
jgi:hypothetical protein